MSRVTEGYEEEDVTLKQKVLEKKAKELEDKL